MCFIVCFYVIHWAAAHFFNSLTAFSLPLLLWQFDTNQAARAVFPDLFLAASWVWDSPNWVIRVVRADPLGWETT